MLLLDARYLRQPRSGIPRYTLNLLDAIRQADPGRRVRVLVPHDNALPETLAAHGPFDAIVDTHAPRDPREAFRWPRRLKHHRPEAVHCPDAYGPLSGGPARLITIHDLIPLVCRDGLQKSKKQRLLPAWKAWMTLQARRADGVITVSECSANDIADRLGIARTKLHVVPNAVPTPPEDASQPAGVEASLSALGIKASDVLALCVGRFDPYKNVPLLIDAFSELLQTERRHPRIDAARLVLVGPNDPRYREPRDRATAHALGDRVLFTGEVSDLQLHALYRRAAVLVMPSRYEGFGLPAVEAMRYGVPVVATRGGALDEVGGNAIVKIDVNDQNALTLALDAVLTSDAMSLELSRLGRAQARDRFAPEAIGARYLEVLDRVTLGKRA